MVQLSEHAELQAVFDDLVDADGAVIEMRAADALVPDGSLSYRDVVAAAAASGASAFGYRIGATGTVTLNPPQSTPVSPGPDDPVALIAPRRMAAGQHRAVLGRLRPLRLPPPARPPPPLLRDRQRPRWRKQGYLHG